MKTKTRLSCVLMLGAAMLSFSHAVWSMGLGAARVESFLDQALDARIELITQEGDDLSAISVSLASADDYELIGASLDDISVPLQFAVQGVQGESYISVRSDLPISDPIVRLIIEVKWASGRQLREYTLFLDPATFSQPAPRSQAAPSAAKEQPSATPQAPTQPADTASRVNTPVAANRPSATPGSNSTAASEYGPVQSGDTLWRIAQNWSDGTDLNINKVMLAIQRRNPDAFAKNNINLLQRGAILRMPELTEVNSISASMAAVQVRDQTAALNAYEPSTSSGTPLLVDDNAAPEPDDLTQSSMQEEEPQQAEEEPQQAAEETMAGPDSQLELVPPSQASASDSAVGFEETIEETQDTESVQALREVLARKEEELINQQQQNSYLEQRLAELESQVAERQAGTVEDENLADMEQRLRAERLAGGEEAAADRAVPKVAAPQKSAKPWYSGLMFWMVALLILLALIAGWFMSRNREPAEIAPAAGADDTLREIKHEAEDVLRVLDAEDTEVAPADSAKKSVDADDKTVVAPASEKTVEAKKPYKPAEGEAELLDEESADPEIQLDLARAYISMGDKEAARVILEEVIAHGSDKQQTEAAKMKSFL